MILDSWKLDPDFKCARRNAPMAAPCGCVGKDQVNHWSEPDTHIECLGCGAVWDGDEAYEWQTCA